MVIKILGIGCPNCKKLEKNARDAAQQLQIEADFVKVTEVDEIGAYGILKTPGLVVDEKVVSFGRIPAVEEIVEMLKQA